ncbi:unnamed protein product, partial [Coregonus sp. 'balchen']
RLINTVDRGYNRSVWIGLEKGDTMVWQWSLAERDYYGEEGTGFRKESEGEPDNGKGRVEEECAVMDENGQWRDIPFNFKLSFYCYGETPGSDQNRVTHRSDTGVPTIPLIAYGIRTVLQYGKEYGQIILVCIGFPLFVME